MKQFFLILLLIAFTLLAAPAQETQSYLNAISKIAQQKKLELSYSPELVDLSEEINFDLHTNVDSCLSQIAKAAKLRFSITENHLIVTPAPPSRLELKGKVVNAQTGETLPHAHLLIKKAGTGTITNSRGVFSFKIPGKFAGEEISFSFLGYENASLLIPYNNADSLLVKMQPKPYNLSDVYVLPNGNEALDIVKRAVKNIKRNYHRSPAQMEMFYRNTQFRDTTASQLIEAVLLVEDKGISKPTNTTKLELKEIRKSTNYLLPKNTKEKAWELLFGHRNIMHSATKRNVLRSYKNYGWYHPLKDFEAFKYEFHGIEWLGDNKVYKIKYRLDWNYSYRQLVPNAEKEYKNKNSDYAGLIFINADDWAILCFEHWNKFYKELADKTKLVDGYNLKSKSEYQKINGKYYLKYMKFRTTPNGRYFTYNEANESDKQKKIKERQWALVTLLVTKIITDKKQFDIIKYGERLAKDENSYEIKYPYNPRFWKSYTVLKENPFEERFLQELEWEKSMDVQFEENSTNTKE